MKQSMMKLCVVLCLALCATAQGQQTCASQADIIFVIDSSGSVGQANFDLTTEFVNDVIDGLDIGADAVRVGALTFESRAVKRFDLNSYVDANSMKNAVTNIPFIFGSTATWEGIDLMIQMFAPAFGDRPDVQNIAVVITDGNAKTADPIPRAQDAIDLGIKMVAIAINTGELDTSKIKPLASNLDNFYEVQDFSELAGIADTLSGATVCPSGCGGPGDIILAVDASGSIGEANFGLVRGFIKALVTDLDISDSTNRVALITFADVASVRFNLNRFTDKDNLLTEIDNTPYTRGATATADALSQIVGMATVQNGDRSDVPTVVVVITDGVSTVNKPNTIPAAIALRNRGISIVTVAIGTNVDNNELVSMASDAGLMYTASAFADLSGIVTDLRTGICNDVNECDSNPCQNGGVCLDRLGYYQCQCPDGFSGYNCQIQCDVNVDLIIALDRSGSIFEPNFNLMKIFVANVITDLPVFGSGTRVGLITFASDAQIQFNLNTFSTIGDAANSLVSISYTGGATNIANALQLIRLSMFTSANGDRADAKNVVLLITDGASTVSPEDTLPQAKLLRNSGAHIMAIGVGNELSPRELRGIATDPDTNNVMTVANFQDLQNLRTTINTPVCFDANECSSNPCQGGATCVDGINRYTCLCPLGLAGNNCEVSCPGQADVVFIIDSSGSIGQDNFDKVIAFVTKVVSKMEISNDRYRVGIVTFADDGVIQFDLNDFNIRANYLNAIQAIQYTKGSTNTARGLELMRSVFSIVNGDRLSVPNVALLLTDGVPKVRKGEERTQADLAKAAGILIKTVGIGNVDIDLLGSLTTAPVLDNLVIADTFDDLDAIADITEICTA